MLKATATAGRRIRLEVGADQVGLEALGDFAEDEPFVLPRGGTRYLSDIAVALAVSVRNGDECTALSSVAFRI